jgi:hypothetical protein
MRESGISQNGTLWNQGEVLITPSGLISREPMNRLAVDTTGALLVHFAPEMTKTNGRIHSGKRILK